MRLGRRALLLATMGLWGCQPEGWVAEWGEGALAMLVTEHHVYFTSGVDHSGLLRIARSGDEDEPTVFHDRMRHAVALADGGDAVYVATKDGVERVPRVGAGASRLVEEPEGVVAICADAAGVHWLTSDGVLGGIEAGERLAPRRPGRRAHALAMDATSLHVATADGLVRVGRSGGAAVPQTRGPLRATQVVVLDEALVVAHAGGLSRVSATGELDLVAEAKGAVGAAAGAGDGVVWAEGDRLWYWDRTAIRQIFDSVRVLALAARGRELWWIDGASRSLRRHML
ncbi:MAG: hypothetical protein R3B72_30735 [Polyangiaceae bacterium]